MINYYEQKKAKEEAEKALAIAKKNERKVKFLKQGFTYELEKSKRDITQDVRELYDKGITAAELSKKFKVSKQTIYYYLRKTA